MKNLHSFVYLFIFLMLLASRPVSADNIELAANDMDNSAEFFDEFDDDFDDVLDKEESPQLITDPLIYWNKTWFYFNDRMHFWLVKPASYGWKIIPRPARVGLQNAITNIEFPLRYINCTLQGKDKEARTELSAFLVNTTLGVVGLWNPSQRLFNWQNFPEDFDQTLAVWNIGQGAYLTWPFLGPSSYRGTIGAILDLPLTPTSFAPGGSAVTRINSLSLDTDEYQELTKIAIDKYSAIRNAYVQNRTKVIAE